MTKSFSPRDTPTAIIPKAKANNKPRRTLLVKAITPLKLYQVKTIIKKSNILIINIIPYIHLILNSIKLYQSIK